MSGRQKLLTMLATLVVGLHLVWPVTAQVTVPNTLVSGAIIRASDLNTNFATLGNHALDRLSGGTLSGNVTADPGITIDGIDIGATVCVTCAPTFKDLVLASPATGLTVAGNVIVNSTGKIPALSSTYFTSLSGANLTGLAAANLTGTVPDASFPATLPAASGANLTGLNASNLASGTVPDARFPATLPALNGSNLTAITAANITGGGTATINVTGNAGTVSNGAYITVSNTFVSGQAVTGRSIGSGGDALIVNSFAGAATGLASTAPAIGVGRNSSGTGAPGLIHFVRKDGTDTWIWADTSGNIRTSSTGVAPPQVDTGDTVGTVVGNQTSTLDTKRLLGHDLKPFDALDIVLHTPVRHFVYKSGAYSGSHFQGIIADWSPEFAMDPDKQHPNGRSFNPVSAFGYTVESIKALQEEIDLLKAEVAALKKRRK